MGQACSTDDDKPFVPKPPSPLRVRVATPPPPLVSGSPIENALKRTEAAEREQFKMAKRRDLWASAREGAGPSLPTLNGLWHVERPQRKGAALELVCFVKKGTTWSAVTVREEVSLASLSWYVLLRRGYVSWQFDEQAREVTPFGLPGYTAQVQMRGLATAEVGTVAERKYEPAVLVATTSPDVLYLYRDRKCCLRCWRHDAVIGQKATVLPVQLAVRTRTPSPTESGTSGESFGAAATTAPAPPRAPGGPTPEVTPDVRERRRQGSFPFADPPPTCTDRGGPSRSSPSRPSPSRTSPARRSSKGTPERPSPISAGGRGSAPGTPAKPSSPTKRPSPGKNSPPTKRASPSRPSPSPGKRPSPSRPSPSRSGSQSREPLLEEAEAERIAARAVALWARGKDFTSMLSNLSDFPQLRVSTGSLGKSFSSPDGEERSIRRAYHAACKQLHPDRHVASGTAEQALAGELFKVLSAAYAKFVDPSLEA